MASESCPPPPAQASPWADAAVEGGGGGGGESFFVSSLQAARQTANVVEQAKRSGWRRTPGRVPRHRGGPHVLQGVEIVAAPCAGRHGQVCVSRREITLPEGGTRLARTPLVVVSM